MSLQVLLILLLLVVPLLWLFIRKKYAYFRDRNILYAKPTFPLGSIGAITSWTDVHKFTQNLYSQFKGRDVIGGYFNMTSPEIVLVDLDLVQDVLVDDFKYFPDHGMYYNEKKDPLSPHLYSLRGERWRNMRTKMCSAFSQSSLCAMFDTIADVNVHLKHHVDRFVEQGEPFNAKDVSMRYICDSVGSWAFGMNCRAMEDADPILLRIADRLFRPKRYELIAYMATIAYPNLADYIPWTATPREVRHYFQGMIEETVQHREENNVHRNDFIDLLIEMKNNGCLMDNESGEVIGTLTKDELVAQAFLVFILGYHNCRVMLTFALFELASNETLQERAREEIYRVLGADGELTYQKLEEMTYMQQIADETLRKYPPSPYLERIAKEDYYLKKGGHFIEKGTPILIPTMGIQNDPEIYPEPERFDPDRMSKDKMRARHPASFLPLGAGPRLCLGHRFGYLQVKLALVNLLASYRFSINTRTRRPPRRTNFVTEFSIDEDIWVDAQRI